MTHARRLLPGMLLPVAALALLPAPAAACVTITNQMRWNAADLIADGTLFCRGLRAPCTLRATRVLKPLSAGRLTRRIFAIEIEFGARARYVPEPLDCGGPPWEPTAEQTRRRFYLHRDEAGRYTVIGWLMGEVRGQ
jgi:hypothetical protein